MRRALFAALLNLLPGLGYLYSGTRRTFGLMLLLFWPVLIVGGFIEQQTYNALEATPGGPTPFSMMVAFLIIWMAFPVDAYLEVSRSGKV